MAYRSGPQFSISGLASDPETQAKIAAANGQYTDYVQAAKDAAKKKFLTTTAIGAGTFAAAPGLGALWSGAAPAAAGGFSAGVPASIGVPASFGAPAAIGATAPVLGATSGLNTAMGIANSNIVGTGVNALLGWFGKKSADKATDQARQDQLAANREALALQRQQLEMQARNADLDRADAKALNDAINELKKRELDAAEEERQYQREQTDYLKQKDMARETALAPYRHNSAAAAQKLASMWGIG